MLPLLSGVAIFTYIYVSTTENKGTAQTIYLILAGVMMTMIGLIVAGPWITYASGRWPARQPQPTSSSVHPTFAPTQGESPARSSE
ncbi:hypothetical protein [Trueperella pyogenes]|uniref:hypothetical protein n=1 Tax=Trueperella pyogenes TaxID=1661 RepID=UPI0014329AD8|nr:hypothetical protein [Trueperella pyogenes]QIU86703.1 hypothetical protein HEP79_05410 [Trueperella pyogenes]